MEDLQREYDSLSALRIRKQELAKECERDEVQMRKYWSDLFEEKEPDNVTDRVTSMVKMGMGVFDGAMLAWKLYKKYSKVFRKWKK